MKIFYIKDENGEYISEDGTCRFKMLKGDEARDFLSSPEGQERCFARLRRIEGDEDEINIETTKDKLKPFRVNDSRVHYVTKRNKKRKFTILSMSSAEYNLEQFVEESIADENVDVVEEVFNRLDLVTLYRAVCSLPKEERDVILALFSDEDQKTTRGYAEEKGLHQTTVMRLKKRALKNIKKFF